MREGKHVYSPIVHCHPLAVTYDLPKEVDFWERFNFSMLIHARSLRVYMLDGWKDSRGLAGEIQFAQDCGIPVQYEAPSCDDEEFS